MSNALIARLFYLSCEHRPSLPDDSLMSLLGSWKEVVKGGAQYGLGAAQKLPGVSFDQLSGLYEAGIESGSAGDEVEFRSLLAGLIHSKVCESEKHSSLDKIKLAGRLDRWLNGGQGQVSEQSLDWDADIIVPPFTKTGFFPIDRIHGPDGIAQCNGTILSRPGVGKTTIALSTGIAWRRNDIGAVTMIQTEIPPSMLLMKIKGMNAKGLFRKGTDKLIFGVRNAEMELEHTIQNPDPDRLLLFDSVGGFCGQGDTTTSRERFSHLYTMLVQASAACRVVLAYGHVKRGVDLADLESAAGSSAVERFSRSLVYLKTDGTSGPTGTVDIRIQSLKNSYGEVVSPFTFGYNYTTGVAVESAGNGDEGEEF